MDSEQAKEIKRHLMSAIRAMSRAEHVIGHLDRDDLLRFIEPVSRASGDLYYQVLWPIYQQFPTLRPPPTEIPTINSTLRWDDVQLPASVTAADLDGVILSVMTTRSQKVARIVGDAFIQCKERSWPIQPDIIAARLQALAEAGTIESTGDLRYWRLSEVNLKNVSCYR